MTTRALLVLSAVALTTTLSACSDEAASTGEAVPSPPAAASTAASTAASVASVTEDAVRLAPALESYSRQAGYAMNLDEALALLDDADLAPTSPNVVGGYAYNADDIEFTLCVEAPDGAWAAYDTRPMTLVESGESGGCP